VVSFIQTAGYVTPEMFEAHPSKSPAENTAAIQASVDATPLGAEWRMSNPYAVTAPIKIRGGKKYSASRNAMLTVASGVSIPAVMAPYSWFTTNQADLTSVAQADKLRPIFDGLSFGEGDGTVTEALMLGTWAQSITRACEFVDASVDGLRHTSKNQNGDEIDQSAGNKNLFGNQVISCRFADLGGQAYYAQDGDLTILSDGVARDLSITNCGNGIKLDSGQGWRILGGQMSAVAQAIELVRWNNTIIGDVVVNAAGNKNIAGRRAAIKAGGGTTDGALLLIHDITVEMNRNALQTGPYAMIDFWSRSGGGNRKVVNILGGAFNFKGFAGTTGQMAGITQQSVGGSNDILGLIDQCTFTSDQNVDGSMTDAPISLQGSSRIKLGRNYNGPTLIA